MATANWNQRNDWPSDAKFIETRRSLLIRLKNRDDHESWKTFFDTYWRLIYSAAIKSGLTAFEAEEVVQETIISVMNGLPAYERRPEKRHFRNWLLRRTMWRVRDQFRKRPGPMEHLRDTSSSTTENGPGAFHSISSASVELERIWNEEWDRNLIQAVLDRVKQKVNLKDYQLFDLVVIREWSVSKVARLLKVSNCRVYLAKHRINKLVRAELKKIRAEAL